MLKERMRRCHELQRIEQKMQTQKHLTVGGTQRERLVVQLLQYTAFLSYFTKLTSMPHLSVLTSYFTNMLQSSTVNE